MGIQEFTVNEIACPLQAGFIKAGRGATESRTPAFSTAINPYEI